MPELLEQWKALVKEYDGLRAREKNLKVAKEDVKEDVKERLKAFRDKAETMLMEVGQARSQAEKSHSGVDEPRRSRRIQEKEKEKAKVKDKTTSQ